MRKPNKESYAKMVKESDAFKKYVLTLQVLKENGVEMSNESYSKHTQLIVMEVGSRGLGVEALTMIETEMKGVQVA